MSDKPVFTTRQHLEAYIRAIQTVFEQSSHTSDLLVAGAFEACLERINWLHARVDSLQTQISNSDEIQKAYAETQEANLARIAELENELSRSTGFHNAAICLPK